MGGGGDGRGGDDGGGGGGGGGVGEGEGGGSGGNGGVFCDMFEAIKHAGISKRAQPCTPSAVAAVLPQKEASK